MHCSQMVFVHIQVPISSARSLNVFKYGALSLITSIYLKYGIEVALLALNTSSRTKRLFQEIVQF